MKFLLGVISSLNDLFKDFDPSKKFVNIHSYLLSRPNSI